MQLSTSPIFANTWVGGSWSYLKGQSDKNVQETQAVWPDWAKIRRLGYFLPEQFSPEQTLPNNGLLQVF